MEPESCPENLVPTTGQSSAAPQKGKACTTAEVENLPYIRRTVAWLPVETSTTLR